MEISEKEFLTTAEEINGILHENGIIKDDRARFISAILLALSMKTEITLTDNPIELISAINTKVDIVLKRENKEEFARFIHINIPSSEDNHIKLKNAIVKTIQALLGLNIHSAMLSGKDVLGKFYEVFLKYGNGAKDLGIVLTPRHITRFAVEVMDIQANDFVLDPTCGTGGFLVAAFDEVKRKASEKDFQKFRKWGLYGIEEQDAIVALALVNMIFRGDGKNNIIEGNCFSNWYYPAKNRDGEVIAEAHKENDEKRIPPMTKVLMNPPFPKKKPDKKEFLFVEHALKQMQNEGLLFSVLPYSCMIKGGSYYAWRETLLKENTLLAVVTFPAELFSPIGVRTIGIFIRKGIPHNRQSVLWIRAMHDGFKLKKGRRLPNPDEPDDIEKIKPLLKFWLKNSNIAVENIPEFQKVTTVEYPAVVTVNKGLELCPEAYLDEKKPDPQTIEDGMEQLIRQSVAYLIKSKREATFNG